MELTIPMWLLWVVGVILSLAFLFVFVVGLMVVYVAWRDRHITWF